MSEEQLKHFSAGKHISDTQNINKSGIPHHEVFDFETAEIEPVDSDPTRIAAVSHSVPSYDGVHTGVNDSDILDFESVPEKQADSLSDILSELSLLSYADEEGARSGNNSSKRKKHASFKASKKSPVVSLWQDFYAWFSSKLINKIISAVVLVAFTCGIVLCFSIPGKSKNVSVDNDSLIIDTDTQEKEEKDQKENENSKYINEDKYKGVLLTKAADAGDEYVNNTLFIGDSNTARINLYGLLPLQNVIGIESMGIQSVVSEPSVYFYDRENPVTIPKAVEIMQPLRIVFCFGTNNLASYDADEFTEKYKKALSSIHEAYEYADIIISAIPPLGSDYSANKNITQKKVDQFNQALIDLAKEEGLTFLDITEVLADKTGYMKKDYVISDGIHISKQGFQALGKYFRTHPHITNDSRPTPLNKIPTRKPAPAKKVETLDTDKIIEIALKHFTDNGFTLPGNDIDLNNGEKITFSIPSDAKEGDEVSWGNNLYQSVLARTTLKKGFISINCKEDTSTKEYIFTARIVPDKGNCDHEFDEGKIIPAEFACCSGYTVRVCKICGYEDKQQDIQPAAEHVFDETTLEPASVPSCTDTDVTWICKTCHQKQTTHIAATSDHVCEEWSISLEPSCTEPGASEGICKYCGQLVNRVDSPLGHSWIESHETIPATDTEPAYDKYSRTCTRCGAIEETYTPIQSQAPESNPEG